MNVMIIRSKVKPEHGDAVERAVHDLFAAIEQAQPQGIRYASGRLADGVTYIAQLQVDDGIENPLPALPEFREFQKNLKQWLAEPPTPEQLTVVGTYRLF
jgi:hypothetical protein